MTRQYVNRLPEDREILIETMEQLHYNSRESNEELALNQYNTNSYEYLFLNRVTPLFSDEERRCVFGFSRPSIESYYNFLADDKTYC